MPGTFAVDIPATFSMIMLVNITPKPKFGGKEGEQETNSAGIPQWIVEAAATFSATTPGMRPVSEMVSITITDRQMPGQGLNPGTPVVFEGLRVGLNPPEVRDGKLRGGRLWYNATSLRPLAASAPARSERAA